MSLPGFRSNEFYIHNLANRLKNHIKSFGLCMRFRQVDKSQPRLPLTPTAGATVTQPFEHWQIDHFSYPQPVDNTISTANVLVLTCEFTKYVYLFLVRSIGADEVIQALRSITRVHGPFIRIQYDRGSSFTFEIMSKYTKITGTKWVFDSAKQPQSTGQVESGVKLAKEILKYIVTLNPSIAPQDAVAEAQFITMTS